MQFTIGSRLLVCDLDQDCGHVGEENKENGQESAHKLCVIREIQATDQLMDPMKYVETGF